MSNYALIKNGIVDNVIVWDGQGNVFKDFTSYKISEGEYIGPGFTAVQNNNMQWEFKPPEPPVDA